MPVHEKQIRAYISGIDDACIITYPIASLLRKKIRPPAAKQ
jgi:hypothetical protein